MMFSGSLTCNRTCNRCHRAVPGGQLACACFAAKADEEAADLAAARYTAHEFTLSVNVDGHVRWPGKNVTFCGVKWWNRGIFSTREMPPKCQNCVDEIARRAKKVAEETRAILERAIGSEP